MNTIIENIVFSKFVNQSIPFELIAIQNLFKRCDKSAYDLSKPHRIEFHSLIIITEGISTHTVDFKEEKLSPGVMIPLTQGQVHSFNKDKNICGFVISFDESFITKNISEKKLFHFLHLFHNPRIIVGKDNLESLLPVIQFLNKIQNDTNENLKADLINAALITFLIQVTRFSIKEDNDFGTKRFKDFLQLKQLISSHYKESHKAEFYANKLSVSYKYLNDVCKEITNQTAKSFIDSWLLLEIKRNLAEEKYTTKEITFKMGFNEPSNFVRFFKKYTGVTPNKYYKDS